MEYLIPIIFATLGIYYNNKFTETKRLIFIGIILIYVVALLGLRYRVGMDTIGYMKSFEKARDLEHFWTKRIFFDRHEPGYLFVCAICKSISKEFWVLQTVISAITNTCVFIFLNRYCKNVFIGLVFFFILQWLYFSTEIMREGVAIGVFLLNYRNLENKKWIRYYLLSLISISFHYSAVIIWFIPLAKYLKLNLPYIIICVCTFAITPILIRMSDYIPIDSISHRIIKYLGDDFNFNLNWKIGEFIKAAFPTIFVMLFSNLLKIKPTFNKLLLIQLLLCIGTFSIPIIFSRFSNYTSIFVTVAIANFLTANHIKSWIKILFISLILTTQSYYYYKMYATWMPYVSIINPKYVHEREQLWIKMFR